MRKPRIIIILIFGFLILFQWAGDFKYGDPDAYYHLQAAELIFEGRLSDQFPWLQFTTWKNNYADQHYLFHLLLIPFILIKAEWLIIPVLTSLMFLTFYYLLTRLNLSAKAWWLIVLAIGSADFLFRVNLIKANTLSLVFLFSAIILLLQKRYIWLLPLSALFVWTYGGFVFLPLVVGLWVVTTWIFNRSFEWKPFVFCIAGIAISIILHPQAQNLLPYLNDQIFQTGLGGNRVVPVGAEWAHYEWGYFIKTNAIVLLLWFGSAAILLRQFKEPESSRRNLSVYFFLLSLGFWILTLVHRRFIEYSVPFSVLSSAYLFSPYLLRIRWQQIKQLCAESWQFVASSIVLISLLIVVGYSNIALTLRYFQFAPDKIAYRDAATWLINNTQENDVIFNTQWDQFPQLFYWNDKNYYIVGLDPTFMYLHSPDLYWQWRNITDDNPEKWGSDQGLANIIKQDFRATYLFVEPSRNPNLQTFVQNSEYFERVHEDQAASVYHIK